MSRSRKSKATLSSRGISARLIARVAHQFDILARKSDISMREYRTLAYLQDGSRRAGEVALLAAVTRPTMSALLASLRNKGWIADRVDPVDGRVLKVVLTASGRARLKKFDNELADRFEKLIPGVDLARLHAMLGEVWVVLAETMAKRRLPEEQSLLRRRQAFKPDNQKRPSAVRNDPTQLGLAN